MIDTLIENIPAFLTFLATVGILRSYMKKLLKLNKEIMDLQTVIVRALADDEITKDEIAAIKKEAADIPAAIRSVIDPIKNLISRIFRSKK